MENKFGRESVLNLDIAFKDKTYIKNMYFTAPFKVMKPFYNKDFMEIMQMSASAGIMKGDSQKVNINVSNNCKCLFTSQSYEKIHKMDKGSAERETQINVGSDSTFIYKPLPSIPFGESSFRNKNIINLQDESSKLAFFEVLSCGRAERGEKFQYGEYGSLVEVRCQNRLIYRDNAYFNPKMFNMSGLGMYEGHTHLLNILIVNLEFNFDFWDLIKKSNLDGGVSQTENEDIVIKILGDTAQELTNFSDKVAKCIISGMSQI